MKKFLLLTLTLLFLLSLVSCGGEDGDKTEQGDVSFNADALGGEQTDFSDSSDNSHTPTNDAEHWSKDYK